MSESYDFDAVDQIAVGTVGPTGQRLFLLQARQGSMSVTLKMEKAQVAALCQYLGRLLADLPRAGHLHGPPDLGGPAEPEWVVGNMGLSYDEVADHVLLIVEEAVGEDEVGAVAQFRATREQVSALAIQGTLLVEAGRPPCPLCSYPLDPSGHDCPKTNGHRPPTT
ncbi:MAG: DUF3090 family protein [Acidimicrobiales bacterium]